ncbi:hypothetical protein DPEC_G00200930 [Dallia pectoralis]|uniref:Uncharacterized protein n=1 Tax=Dallia pectoralis TaxID=75939 RepID=A0ACC2G8V8_DALPE|nr:hypothetical protein DPEC_G00200930 [Dallia pectoralis]
METDERMPQGLLAGGSIWPVRRSVAQVDRDPEAVGVSSTRARPRVYQLSLTSPHLFSSLDAFFPFAVANFSQVSLHPGKGWRQNTEALNRTGCHGTPRGGRLDAKSLGARDARSSGGFHTDDWPRVGGVAFGRTGLKMDARWRGRQG